MVGMSISGVIQKNSKEINLGAKRTLKFLSGHDPYWKVKLYKTQGEDLFNTKVDPQILVLFNAAIDAHRTRGNPDITDEEVCKGIAKILVMLDKQFSETKLAGEQVAHKELYALFKAMHHPANHLVPLHYPGNRILIHNQDATPLVRLYVKTQIIGHLAKHLELVHSTLERKHTLCAQEVHVLKKFTQKGLTTKLNYIEEQIKTLNLTKNKTNQPLKGSSEGLIKAQKIPRIIFPFIWFFQQLALGRILLGQPTHDPLFYECDTKSPHNFKFYLKNFLLYQLKIIACYQLIRHALRSLKSRGKEVWSLIRGHTSLKQIFKLCINFCLTVNHVFLFTPILCAVFLLLGITSIPFYLLRILPKIFKLNFSFLKASDVLATIKDFIMFSAIIFPNLIRFSNLFPLPALFGIFNTIVPFLIICGFSILTANYFELPIYHADVFNSFAGANLLLFLGVFNIGLMLGFTGLILIGKAINDFVEQTWHPNSSLLTKAQRSNLVDTLHERAADTKLTHKDQAQIAKAICQLNEIEAPTQKMVDFALDLLEPSWPNHKGSGAMKDRKTLHYQFSQLEYIKALFNFEADKTFNRYLKAQGQNPKFYKEKIISSIASHDIAQMDALLFKLISLKQQAVAWTQEKKPYASDSDSAQEDSLSSSESSPPPKKKLSRKKSKKRIIFTTSSPKIPLKAKPA